MTGVNPSRNAARQSQASPLQLPLRITRDESSGQIDPRTIATHCHACRTALTCSVHTSPPW
jgi:hypothetical protein